MNNIINFDEIQETTYINKEGEYALKVTDFESATTTNGNLCHAYTCKTETGEQIRLNFYITPKALWKYKIFLGIIGVDNSGNIDIAGLPSKVLNKKFKGEVVRSAPIKRTDIETGKETIEESKYFEIDKFHRLF